MRSRSLLLVLVLSLPLVVSASSDRRTYVPFLGRTVPEAALGVPVHVTDTSFRDFGARLATRGFNTTGRGIEVCVIDTGIDPTHEQLDTRVVAFHDFTLASKQRAYDDHGHGTHVASIIAGDGEGSRGAKRFRGVAPAAVLSVAKALDANGSGSVGQVINAIAWCASRPQVRIISMSLSTIAPVRALDDAVQVATTTYGKVVVVAAGNRGPMYGSMGSPASAPSAITVGAAADWSGRGEAGLYSAGPYLAPFSSRGLPGSDPKPDVIGPGVTVVAASACQGQAVPDPPACTSAHGGYHAWSGTSMATPYVAGTVALMLEADPSLTPEQVKAILTQTALDLGQPGKDPDYGSGLINSYSAVAAVEGAPGRDIFPPHETLSATVDGGRPWFRWLTADTLDQPMAVTVLVYTEDAHYGATVYAIDSKGTVDVSICPNVEPLHVPWCGYGASGRQQVVSGFPKLVDTLDYKGNHVLALFPDSIWTPMTTGLVSFTVDIFLHGSTAPASPTALRAMQRR